MRAFSPPRRSVPGRRRRPSCERLEDRIAPAVITVNSLGDDVNPSDPQPGDLMTLREAIAVANSNSATGLDAAQLAQISGVLGDDTIRFDPGTIPVGGFVNDIVLNFGPLALTDAGHRTTIQGPGADHLEIDLSSDRVFQVAAGVTAAIDGLRIVGSTSDPSGGGAIANSGALTVSHAFVDGTAQGGPGGGIANSGALTVGDSAVSGHAASGGGLFNSVGGVTTVLDSTVGGQAASGGGLYNSGVMTVRDSTVTAAIGGGGIVNAGGTLTVDNSTVSGNYVVTHAAAIGVGIRNAAGSVTLHNTIVAGNYHFLTGSPYDAGFPPNPGLPPPGPFDSLASDVLLADDVLGAVQPDSGANLIGSGRGLVGIADGVNGNQVGAESHPIDPGLGPLGLNFGGQTLTFLPLPGSPAVGAGDPSFTGPPRDQNGLPRVLNGRLDIGAVEVQPAHDIVVATTSDAPDATGMTLRDALRIARYQPGAYNITFDPALFAGGPATIALTRGPLVLDNVQNPVTVVGPGAGLLTLDGGGATGVFQVTANSVGRVSGLTFADGAAADFGGGLLNRGRLILLDSAFAHDTAPRGGAVENQGDLTLIHVAFAGNSSGDGSADVGNDGALQADSASLAGGATVIGNANGLGHSFNLYASIPQLLEGNMNGLFGKFEGLSLDAGYSTPFALSPFSSYTNLDGVVHTIGASGPGDYIFTESGNNFLVIGRVASGQIRGVGLKISFNTIERFPSAFRINGVVNPAVPYVSDGAGLDVHGPTFRTTGSDFGLVVTTTEVSFTDLGAVPAVGQLSGTVYLDGNGNGAVDPGEAGLADRTVYLDLKHDGRIDPGDPVSVTNRGGAYRFTGLPAGTYTVRLAAPAGLQAVGGATVTLAVAADGTADLGVRRVAVAPGVLTVTTTADNTAADGALSLREALTLVSAGTLDPAYNGLGRALTPGELAHIQGTPGVGSVIRFALPPGPQIIALTQNLPAASLDLNVEGPGSGLLTLDGGGRVSSGFMVDETAHVSVSGLTFAHGNRITFDDRGVLTVNSSVFDSNTAADGGAIVDENGGTLTINNTAFLRNTDVSSALNPSGVLTIKGAAAAITGSLFDSNTVTGTSSGSGSGGGTVQCTGGSLIIVDSTFRNNTAFEGGAIHVETGTGVMINSTVWGNHATEGRNAGGGIWNNGSLTMYNSIVAGNDDLGRPNDVGGGNGVNPGSSFNIIGVDHLVYEDVPFLGLIIIDGFAGIIDGVDGNRIGTLDHPIDPLLGLLGNYGGPTATLPLLPGSPALDAGGNAVAVNPVTGRPLTTDQRGFPRILGGTVDVGAFESHGFTMTFLPGAGSQAAAPGTAFLLPLGVLATANGTAAVTGGLPEPVQGGAVTFTVNPGATRAAALLNGSAGPITVTIVPGGQASVAATANGTLGAYSVTASARGAQPRTFLLYNLTPKGRRTTPVTTGNSAGGGKGVVTIGPMKKTGGGKGV